MNDKVTYEKIQGFTHGDHRYEVVQNSQTKVLGLVSYYIDPKYGIEEDGVDVDTMQLEELGEVAGLVFGIHCEPACCKCGSQEFYQVCTKCGTTN